MPAASTWPPRCSPISSPTSRSTRFTFPGWPRGNPGSADEPYIEQAANDATALDEALATDYDGTLRFAPAWPSGWDTSGTIYIQGGGDAGRRGCHTDRRRCASGSNPSPITCRL